MVVYHCIFFFLLLQQPCNAQRGAEILLTGSTYSRIRWQIELTWARMVHTTNMIHLAWFPRPTASGNELKLLGLPPLPARAHRPGGRRILFSCGVLLYRLSRDQPRASRGWRRALASCNHPQGGHRVKIEWHYSSNAHSCTVLVKTGQIIEDLLILFQSRIGRQ